MGEAVARPDSLLTRMSKGDETAFEAAYSRHGRMVLNACLRQLDDRHNAEDAVQASFLVLWRKVGRLGAQTDLGAWLHQVAVQVAREANRTKNRRERRERAAAERHTQTASSAEWAAIRGDLDEAIQRLPARQRAIIVLGFLEGLSREEVGQRLGLPEGTVAKLRGQALARLRERLGGRQQVFSVAALAALLTEHSAEAALTPELLSSLLAAKAETAGAAAAAAGSSGAVPALVEGVLRTMWIAQLKCVAAILSAVIATGVLYCAEAGMARPEARVVAVAGQEPVAGKPPEAKEAEIIIAPQGADAWNAFEELQRKGGPRVAWLKVDSWPQVLVAASWRREQRHLFLPVPRELLFKPVAGRELIEAVALAHGLKVAWRREGRFAVLYGGAMDADVERVKTDLSSTVAAVRREAAWRGGWLPDPRIVPLLARAARDADVEVARQAVRGLRRLTWKAVGALDETVMDLLAAEVANAQEFFFDAIPIQEGRMSGWSILTTALTRQSGEEALQVSERRLALKDDSARLETVFALGQLGGPQALAALDQAWANPAGLMQWEIAHAVCRLGKEKTPALIDKLEKVLAAPEERPAGRWHAALALGQEGGDKAMAFFAEKLAEKKAGWRAHAIISLCYIGGDKALAHFEKAIADLAVQKDDPYLGTFAIDALDGCGAEQAWLLLEKALTDPHVCAAALSALSRLGGEKALAPLEKALNDQDEKLRRTAATALGNLGGAKALALLEKAYTDPDEETRENALFAAVRCAGGEEALALLEKALADPNASTRGIAALNLGELGGEKATALLEKALADQDPSVRRHAAFAFGQLGGGLSSARAVKALAPLEKALADQDASVRWNAAFALGRVGGEQSVALLEKALADQDLIVRRFAVQSLGRVGGEKALTLLEKMLADRDANLRGSVASALGRAGGVKARDLLLKQLAADTDPTAFKAVQDALRLHYRGDPTADKALKEPAPQPAAKEEF